MKHMSYAAALAEAVHQAMANDERVSLIAGHLLGLGPHAALMQQIYDDFPDRIFDPPNAEAALAGLGAGAAMAGGRPIVNLGTANFAYLALSQIINDAATTRHMTNGALGAPVVYFALQGVRGAGAAQHLAAARGQCCGTVRLADRVAGDPGRCQGLDGRGSRRQRPTVFLSHAKLLGVEGPVPEGRTRRHSARLRSAAVVATSPWWQRPTWWWWRCRRRRNWLSLASTSK
jgi:pyruvate/2-oxoglutarate/acetoin dehydrogenase E1 component